MTLTQLKNKTLLLLGFTLVNNYGHTVYLEDFKQVRSNKNRRRKYSMDDKSWKILWH